MKKYALLLLCVILLSGCSGSTKCPAYMDEEMFNYGKKALDVAEQCMSGDITDEEALEKLDTIQDKASAWNKAHPSDENYKNLSVVIDILALQESLIRFNQDYVDFEKAINELKDTLK